MGGWGSGRQGGRPTADASLRIDLAWMLRRGWVREGAFTRGSLHWTRGGQPSASISYTAAMDEPGEERLHLSFTRGSGDEREHVQQAVRLCHTVPNYGGKRWWMICPFRHIRVGKLYLPPDGDRFASRQAWRLGYHIQRVAARDRSFERLFRLQRRLDCGQGWEAGLQRPKGMWQRTFDRHMKRYWELDAECAVEMLALIGRLGRR
jgi:hypothetical protein